MFYTPWMTERTRAQWEGRAEKQQLMLWNRKPYRTKAQKHEAERRAVKCTDGAWRSDAPVSFHAAPKGAGQ